MRRILIVDDNAAVRDVLRTILTRANYDVALAEGGHSALQSLKEQAFDLALIDIEMPDLNGYDVCAYIKTHAVWRVMPVILMTGRAVADVPEKAKIVGAAAFVAKPFDGETLLQTIEAFLPNGDSSDD